MNPDLDPARENPDASLPGQIRTALHDPPASRLSDSECETRAAVTLLLAPDPAMKPGANPSAGLLGRPVSCLFVIRATWDGDPWSGHVALPGGRAEPSDADLIDTARRETREETNIQLGRDSFLGRLNEIHPRSAHLPSIGVTPLVTWLPVRPRITASHEIAGHIWVPVRDLAAPERRSTLIRGEPDPRVFPTIEYAGEIIWGLTHAVIEDFLARMASV